MVKTEYQLRKKSSLHLYWQHNDKLSPFVLLNARSLNNKLPELYNLLYSMQYDVIMVTESWLRSSTPSSLLDPHNEYIVLRCDRQSVSPCGGVCVFISKKYNVVPIDLTEFCKDL